jgi:hypothetical protein
LDEQARTDIVAALQEGAKNVLALVQSTLVEARKIRNDLNTKREKGEDAIALETLDSQISSS